MYIIMGCACLSVITCFRLGRGVADPWLSQRYSLFTAEKPLPPSRALASGSLHQLMLAVMLVRFFLAQVRPQH